MARKKYFGYTVDEVPRYVYHPDKEKHKFELSDPELRKDYRQYYIWFDEMRADMQVIADELTGEADLRDMLKAIKNYRGKKGLARHMMEKFFEWRNILLLGHPQELPHTTGSEKWLNELSQMRFFLEHVCRGNTEWAVEIIWILFKNAEAIFGDDVRARPNVLANASILDILLSIRSRRKDDFQSKSQADGRISKLRSLCSGIHSDAKKIITNGGTYSDVVEMAKQKHEDHLKNQPPPPLKDQPISRIQKQIKTFVSELKVEKHPYLRAKLKGALLKNLRELWRREGTLSSDGKKRKNYAMTRY